jgi:AAA+ ATPase superfamily predicted ATPase
MIGRKEEQVELQQVIESKQSEFVVVFGRRRVGKTFLIREFFKNNFVFYHTGIANGDMNVQLNSFCKSLNEYGKLSFPENKNWLDAFDILGQHSKRSYNGRPVCFLIFLTRHVNHISKNGLTFWFARKKT